MRKLQLIEMRFIKKHILGLALLACLWGAASLAWAKGFDRQPLVIRVFHMPQCKSCIKVIHDIIPPLANKYGSKVQWQYLDLEEEGSYKKYLELQKKTEVALGTPTILINSKIIVGMVDAADRLEKTIQEELKSPTAPILLGDKNVSLIQHFEGFAPLAVIGAGLVDGFNPCAFTVVVFFVSFLSFMGYQRRETALIGSGYILAVFVTYLALGFGFFKAFYALKEIFYMVSKIVYLAIGALSFFLGCVALNDFFRFKKTGQTEGLALQLPRPIKNKIHSIVATYYRKDKNRQPRALLGLFLSALVVGFLISLLEAVCTGQMYLPTIIFVLKEKSLRLRAIFYLVVYNLMFILPLIVVLLLALAGTSSKQFESYARRHLGMIKVAMAAVFFALAIVLWVGV